MTDDKKRDDDLGTWLERFLRKYPHVSQITVDGDGEVVTRFREVRTPLRHADNLSTRHGGES